MVSIVIVSTFFELPHIFIVITTSAEKRKEFIIEYKDLNASKKRSIRSVKINVSTVEWF